MLFPRTIFTRRNTILEQLAHLASELAEVREAVERCDYNHAADELVDVQQSADTALHILMDRHGADSYGAYTRVSVKNCDRGYYSAPAPPYGKVQSR